MWKGVRAVMKNTTVAKGRSRLIAAFTVLSGKNVSNEIARCEHVFSAVSRRRGEGRSQQRRSRDVKQTPAKSRKSLLVSVNI